MLIKFSDPTPFEVLINTVSRNTIRVTLMFVRIITYFGKHASSSILSSVFCNNMNDKERSRAGPNVVKSFRTHQFSSENTSEVTQ